LLCLVALLLGRLVLKLWVGRQRISACSILRRASTWWIKAGLKVLIGHKGMMSRSDLRRPSCGVPACYNETWGTPSCATVIEITNSTEPRVHYMSLFHAPHNYGVRRVPQARCRRSPSWESNDKRPASSPMRLLASIFPFINPM